MRETRVNLKHLLEDIRDSYSLPIEEAIVTELVALMPLILGLQKLNFFLNPVKKNYFQNDN